MFSRLDGQKPGMARPMAQVMRFSCKVWTFSEGHKI